MGAFNLDSEIGVWMQGAAPSALILMLTIFPGLTAGATLCRRFAPGDVICSVWGEIRTHGSSDMGPRRADASPVEPPLFGLMVHPMWSLEEATENSPGRKAGVGIDP